MVTLISAHTHSANPTGNWNKVVSLQKKRTTSSAGVVDMNEELLTKGVFQVPDVSLNIVMC